MRRYNQRLFRATRTILKDGAVCSHPPASGSVQFVSARSHEQSIGTNSPPVNFPLPTPPLNMPTNIEIERLRQIDMLRGAIIFAMDKIRQIRPGQKALRANITETLFVP